jgi:hypothetical protein
VEIIREMCLAAFMMLRVSLFAVVTIMVGLFIDPALFCGSRDFIIALEEENETPFCTFSGMYVATN